MTWTPCDVRRSTAAGDTSDIRTCTTTRPPPWRTRLPAPELGRLKAFACTDSDADFTGSRDSASSRDDSLPPLRPTEVAPGPGATAVVDPAGDACWVAAAATGVLLPRPKPTSRRLATNTPTLRRVIQFTRQDTLATSPPKPTRERQALLRAALPARSPDPSARPGWCRLGVPEDHSYCCFRVAPGNTFPSARPTDVAMCERCVTPAAQPG